MQEILKKKDMEPQIYKQQMALQCSYVCMCHMCSHMCGHMGSCVLDILQGIGTAGAGTVSQVGSRMPNNPLLCNYGLLKSQIFIQRKLTLSMPSSSSPCSTDPDVTPS